MIKYSGVAFSYGDEKIATEIKTDFVRNGIPILFFTSKLLSVHDNVVDVINVYPDFSDAGNKKILIVANLATHLCLEISSVEDILEILMKNNKQLPNKDQLDIISTFICDVDSWFKKEGSELERICEVVQVSEDQEENE